MPPFGHDTALRVFVDPDLLEHDVVWAAAGTWHDVFSLTPNSWSTPAGASSSNSGATDVRANLAARALTVAPTTLATRSAGSGAASISSSCDCGRWPVRCNLAEATALYLEEFPLPLGERPVVTTFRIADVA